MSNIKVFCVVFHAFLCAAFVVDFRFTSNPLALGGAVFFAQLFILTCVVAIIDAIKESKPS